MQTDRSVPARRIAERLPVKPWMRALAWGILSLVGFIASWIAVGWLMVQLEQAFGLPHAIHLGLGALAWVPASGLLALAAARVGLGTWPAVPTVAWLLLLAGALVSAAHLWVLADWAIGRYGYTDPDYIGPTFALHGVVAAAALAGFEVQIAPRWAAWLPFLAMVGGVALAIAIISWNIPGLANGLGRDSEPLAAVTVAAALYIGAVGIVSLARLRRG